MADKAEKKEEIMADKKNQEEKTLTDVYAGYAEKATEKDPYEFSLLEKYDVEFTKDFKTIKKGHKMQGISKVAYDLYAANDAVKLLKKTEAPADANITEE